MIINVTNTGESCDWVRSEFRLLQNRPSIGQNGELLRLKGCEAGPFATVKILEGKREIVVPLRNARVCVCLNCGWLWLCYVWFWLVAHLKSSLVSHVRVFSLFLAALLFPAHSADALTPLRRDARALKKASVLAAACTSR